MSESKEAAETSQPVVTTDSSNIIKVTVKTLKQKEQFEVAQSSTIQEFKEEVAKRFKVPPDLLVLVFAGKVLKDQDTLSQHGVRSGVSIHAVIRSQKRPQDGPADQGRATTPTRPPSHGNCDLFYSGSVADLQNPCLIRHNLSELLTFSREIAAQTMENLLSRIRSSGLDLNTINNNAFLVGFLLGVTSVHLLGLDSTDLLDLVSGIQEQDASMHSLMGEMVQSTFLQNNDDDARLVRDLIMSNPQLRQLAEDNPEIGQILTDPHTIREILEASSRSPAVMQEMMRNRDVAMKRLESIPGGYRALEQCYREIEEPMLEALQAQLGNNPFASSDSDPPPSGARLPARTENRRPLPNPWAPRSHRVRDNADDSDGQLASSSAGNSFALLSLGLAAGAVVPNSGEVQSMVQQLRGYPELMHNLARALTNPDGPAQMLLNSTHTSSNGNSPPQDQRPQQLPPEKENAEISSLPRNPRALQTLLQIQLGLETLSTEVPDVTLSLGDSQVELESMEDSAESSNSEDGVILVSGEDEADGQMEMDEEAPRTIFQRQMEQLSAMGFQDQSANLQALIEAEGDLNAAVEILAKAPSSKKIL